MTVELVASPDLWPKVTDLCQSAADGDRSVAVAYIGAGAFDFLPMGPGDVLVLDCSPTSAAAGATNPSEVKRFLDAGVGVYRWQGLHTKAYVFGNTAVVGSPNASNHSRWQLDEAALVVTTRATVTQIRRLIESYCVAEVDDEWISRCQEKWRPPKFVPTSAGAGGWHPIPASDDWRLWCVETREADLPRLVDAAIGQHHKSVRILRPGRYWLETIAWDPNPRFRKGDVLIERFEDAAATIKAYPPAVIEDVWTAGRGARERTIVTLMRPRGIRPVADSTLQRAARNAGLRLGPDERLILKSDHRRALIAIWPSLSEVTSSPRDADEASGDTELNVLWTEEDLSHLDRESLESLARDWGAKFSAKVPLATLVDTILEAQRVA